jgi:hypothetical protein
LESDVSTEEDDDGAFHEDRFCHTVRMLTTLLNVSVDNKLPTGAVSSISEFHDDKNFGSSGEEKVRARALSFTDTDAAYGSVYSIVLHVCAHHWQA